MHLKTYQSRILQELSDYLAALRVERDKYDTYYNHADENIRELAKDYNFPQKAWTKTRVHPHTYHPETDGCGDPLPNGYLKVPTGGGKTLLACHAVGLVQNKYLRRNTGIVLWIVPTQQIYRQTLKQLRDRNHPYRQLLDVISGGRTVVAERFQPFSRNDANNKLLVLLLMLPAANRQTNETLRLFRDSGGYEDFFPHEGNTEAHRALMAETKNLDAFQADNTLLTPQIKTSLGNVLRLRRPLLVLDEGHKAYSANARNTVAGFNPAFLLQLSATPPEKCNIIAAASGRELDEEEMIKLDINLHNQPTPDWKSALLAAAQKRDALERAADRLRQNTNQYIRPIAVVQVERTGKEQRDGKHIHAEDARDFLVKQCKVPPHRIAVKSSERDDLGNADLLSEECQFRYVITKAALQEGWDCAFAYVLAVLSNLRAQTALTQLIGRVLRQPQARKTGVKALDECYVFTHRKNSGAVAQEIRRGLQTEGLSDLAGRINGGGDIEYEQPKDTYVVNKFKRFVGRLYLPQFVVVKNGKPRPLDYHADILAHLDWEKLCADSLKKINLSTADNRAIVQSVGLEGAGDEKVQQDDGATEIDSVLMTRQIIDVVPNPWHAHMQTKDILRFFTQRYGTQTTAANFIFIIEEAKRLLAEARDNMAEAFFKRALNNGQIQLMLFTGEGEWRIPTKIPVRSKERLTRRDGGQLQRSLFDYVAKEDINDYETSVALYLDEQAQLLWWHRNHVRGRHYALQGWKKHRVYPDFIVAKQGDNVTKSARRTNGMGEVMVVETKGAHLQGGGDTPYKRSLLKLCNELCADAGKRGKLQRWRDLAEDFADHRFRFQMVNEDDWKSALNGMLMPR